MPNNRSARTRKRRHPSSKIPVIPVFATPADELNRALEHAQRFLSTISFGQQPLLGHGNSGSNVNQTLESKQAKQPGAVKHAWKVGIVLARVHGNMSLVPLSAPMFMASQKVPRPPPRLTHTMIISLL